MGRAIRLAASSLVVSAGCALVLDSSSDLGEHCRFDGSTEDLCGLCLATACQAPIDACCGDPYCQGVLDVVDRCGAGDSDACLELDDDPDDPGAGAIVRCLANACDDECGVFFPNLPDGGGGGGGGDTGGGGNAGTDGSTCSEYESFCSCSYGTSPGNDVACDASSLDGAACCANPAYPDEGLCTCERTRCTIDFTYDTCTCGYAVSDPSGGTECGAYSYCCQGFDDCRCNNEFPCSGNETPVPSCSVETIPCPTGVPVTSCSFP